MFSITAKRPGIAVLLHRPQQRPSGGNYSTGDPVSEKKKKITLTALKTHVGHQEQRHAVPDVFPDFSRGECGSWLGPASCPGLSLSARREGVIGRVRGPHLFPLEQRRTVAPRRRGSESGTCPPSPPSYPPHTQHTREWCVFLYLHTTTL